MVGSSNLISFLFVRDPRRKMRHRIYRPKGEGALVSGGGDPRIKYGGWWHGVLSGSNRLHWCRVRRGHRRIVNGLRRGLNKKWRSERGSRGWGWGRNRRRRWTYIWRGLGESGLWGQRKKHCVCGVVITGVILITRGDCALGGFSLRSRIWKEVTDWQRERWDQSVQKAWTYETSDHLLLCWIAELS